MILSVEHTIVERIKEGQTRYIVTSITNGVKAGSLLTLESNLDGTRVTKKVNDIQLGGLFSSIGEVVVFLEDIDE